MKEPNDITFYSDVFIVTSNNETLCISIKIIQLLKDFVLVVIDMRHNTDSRQAHRCTVPHEDLCFHKSLSL